VRLRGPAAHRGDGAAHHLFLAFRTQGILQALDHHESTFLTDKEWMEIPWEGKSLSGCGGGSADLG
jgi:hypothetical protein